MALALAEQTIGVADSLDEVMKIDGALGTALVDWRSGMCLGIAGGGGAIDLKKAAAGNTEVVRAKLKVMTELGLKDRIEDILITLGEQIHILRPLAKYNNLFLYVAFHKAKCNLAMARYKLEEIENQLAV